MAGGTSCQAMLPVGGPRGQDILQHLTANGLDCVTASIAHQNRQCFTVYETQTGHEYRFVLPGPTLSAPEQDACVAAILDNLPTSYLVLSGSLPPGVPEDFYARIIRKVRQAAPNLRIVIDTSGAPLAQALDAGVFLFKPSREELCELCKWWGLCELGELCGIGQHALSAQPKTQRPSTSETARYLAACRTLIEQDRAKVIALTLGSQGSLLVTPDQAWVVDPLSVEVTSTVGAGDSFVGGFVWALAQMSDHPDWAQAARIGTAAASAALQTQGELRFDARAILAASERVRVSPFPLLAA